MNRVIRLCLSLALALGLQAAYPAQPRCELRLMGHVEAQVTHDGTLLLAGSVNGHEVWFELRTFDGISLIREGAVTALGLSATELPRATSSASRIGTTTGLSATAGGRPIERYVKMTGMQLGRIKVPGFDALIVPVTGSSPYFRDRPIVGTIGGKLFSVTDVEINLAENRVSFFQQSDCKDDPVYWSGEFTILPAYFDPAGSLLFPMELDGQKVDTSLVGGTRESRIDESVTRRYFGFDSTSPGIEKRPATDGPGEASFKAMSLTAEGLNIRNTPVRLRQASKCKLTARSFQARAIGYSNCLNTVPMALGTDVLRQLRIYIASKKGRIYISKAVAAAPNP